MSVLLESPSSLSSSPHAAGSINLVESAWTGSCRFAFHFGYFSYAYVPNGDIPNISNMLDLPLNTISTLIPLVCYTYVSNLEPVKRSANEDHR